MQPQSFLKNAVVVLALLGTVFAGNLAAAQEAEDSVVPVIERADQIDILVVTLERATPSKVMALMGPFADSEVMTADDELGAIMLYGPQSVTSRLADAIKALDMAHKTVENTQNIELTVHLIQGSGFKVDDDTSTVDIPNFLADVVSELTDVFMYGQYRLVDTLFLRCRDNSEASTSGTMPGGSGDEGQSMYNFSVDSVRITGGDPIGIRLDDVSFGAETKIVSSATHSTSPRTGRAIERRDVGMRADIDVREGQQVVIGKASVAGDDSALFVVVSAKVVGG